MEEYVKDSWNVFKYDGEKGEVLIDIIEGETDYEMAKMRAELEHGEDAYIK